MNIHNLSIPGKEQASRLRICPTELREYIRVANALPAPEKLPGGEADGSLPIREHWDYSEADLSRMAAEYPSFRELLQGADLREDPGLATALEICRTIKAIRSVLYTIARFERKASGRVPVDEHLKGLVSLELSPKGCIQAKHGPLLRALEGVEAARIRECPVCGAIYWAGRIDKPACSRCSHALRQRRYRENYRQKYKLQRIAKADRDVRSPIQSNAKTKRPHTLLNKKDPH